mmetsp:Transcript_23025/g.35261  ORF Transcript_23025/g.35261 Transcript_23025/m.35261 type:complete len:978 (+) Transcript_23025:114-3047(+)
MHSMAALNGRVLLEDEELQYAGGVEVEEHEQEQGDHERKPSADERRRELGIPAAPPKKSNPFSSPSFQQDLAPFPSPPFQESFSRALGTTKGEEKQEEEPSLYPRDDLVFLEEPPTQREDMISQDSSVYHHDGSISSNDSSSDALFVMKQETLFFLAQRRNTKASEPPLKEETRAFMTQRLVEEEEEHNRIARYTPLSLLQEQEELLRQAAEASAAAAAAAIRSPPPATTTTTGRSGRLALSPEHRSHSQPSFLPSSQQHKLETMEFLQQRRRRQSMANGRATQPGAVNVQARAPGSRPAFGRQRSNGRLHPAPLPPPPEEYPVSQEHQQGAPYPHEQEQYEFDDQINNNNDYNQDSQTATYRMPHAKPVLDEEEERRSCNRKFAFVLGTTGIFLFAGAVVLVFLLLLGPDGDSSKNLDNWKQILGDVTPLSVLMDSATPQHRAWHWLAMYHQVASPTVATIDASYQAYALLVFFFSVGLEELWNPRLHECNIDHTILVCDGRYRLTQLIAPNRGLNGDLPPELSLLTNLQRLNLADNSLDGSLPSLSKASQLNFLHVGGNQLTKGIVDDDDNMESFANLKYLNMSHNLLNGKIPPSIYKLSNLRSLDLSGNLFDGELGTEIENLTKLTSLILRNNELRGTLPPSMGKLSALKLICLDHNLLSGDIPYDPSFFYSRDEVTISYNFLSGSIPEDTHRWNQTNYGIKKLDLNANRLSGSIPTIMEELYSLEYLDLTRNSLTGDIYGFARTPLKELKLAINKLKNTIPSSFPTSLRVLHLHSNNRLRFGLPTEIGRLTNLEFMNIGATALGGTLPTEIASLTKLESLFIDYAEFSGTLPTTIGKLKMLGGLQANGNYFTGQLPAEIGDMGYLRLLDLQHNHFTGSIPTTFSRLGNLQYLSLRFNRISSTIPKELQGMEALTTLKIDYNEIEGTVPDGVCALVDSGTLENLAVDCTISCDCCAGCSEADPDLLCGRGPGSC